MNNKGNIVLIGFMGAGKTTVGRWISQNVNMKYIDTDDYIEAGQNMTIKDIFANYGEEFFRDLETKALEELCEGCSQTVISVGGGMPVRDINRKLMKKLGTVVYLKAAEEELARRLDGDDKRPMLAGQDLRKRIHELIMQRENAYLDASDVVINTMGMSMNGIYNAIEDYINDGGR